MTSYSDDMTLSKPIMELVAVADEYCSYLESAESKTKKGILNLLQRMIPLLYLKGSLLPAIEVSFPEANEKFVTEIEWEIVFNSLRLKFGSEDEYWTIDPEINDETEPIRASLSENLADIYQDMKDMTILFSKNTQAARENAINECSELFNTHWGYRAGQVMARVHYLLQVANKDEFDELNY